MVREGAANERPHRRFGRVIGGSDGIKSAGTPFVLDAQRRSEERQDGLARHRGKLVDESRKIDCSHAAPPHRRAMELSNSRASGNSRASAGRRSLNAAWRPNGSCPQGSKGRLVGFVMVRRSRVRPYRFEWPEVFVAL